MIPLCVAGRGVQNLVHLWNLANDQPGRSTRVGTCLRYASTRSNTKNLESLAHKSMQLK